MKINWSSRTNNFDFLRLALAVLVIYSHSFPLGTGSEMQEPLRVWTHGQMTFGALAVDLFFIISGFLITGSIERSRSIRDFLRKRVARIYPGFLVCAAFCAVVVLPLSGGRFAASAFFANVADFLFQSARLQEFHVTGAFSQNPYPGVINGSVWSIQYEFWCYIGVALLALSGLLRNRRWVLATFAVSVAVSIAFQVRGWVFGGKLAGRVLGSPQLWARLLPLYLAGVVFYLFRDRIRWNSTAAIACITALIAACWIPSGWTAIFPLAGTYLVFYIAYAPWIRLQRAGRFGDFSYGAYLYAFPIEQLLMETFGHPVPAWLLFGCATPLTLLAAVASFHLVEKRFLSAARELKASTGDSSSTRKSEGRIQALGAATVAAD